MKRPKNREYVEYLSRSLQSMLPEYFTNENLYQLHDVCEAIRCVEIVYGEGAGAVELVKKQLRERDLAEEKMRKEAESKCKKLAKNSDCYCKFAMPFLLGYFISSLLFDLLKIFL